MHRPGLLHFTLARGPGLILLFKVLKLQLSYSLGATRLQPSLIVQLGLRQPTIFFEPHASQHGLLPRLKTLLRLSHGLHLARMQVGYLRLDTRLLILELSLEFLREPLPILLVLIIQRGNVFGARFLVPFKVLLALMYQRFLVLSHLLLQFIEVGLLLFVEVHVLLHIIK